MAKAKAKRNSKTEKGYYVVKTVRETRERLTDTIQDYRQTYIEKPLDDVRSFVTDLKDAPQKTISNLVDDGKEMFTDMDKETRQKVSEFIKESRTFLEKAAKEPRQAVTDIWEDGRAKVDDFQKDTRDRMEDFKADYQAVLEGLGKDARMALEELLDTGLKTLDKVPGKKRLEDEISSRIQDLPKRFDLPTKNDIDGLKKRLANLNKKVDTIKKSMAA